jgi:hypothetical protein
VSNQFRNIFPAFKIPRGLRRLLHRAHHGQGLGAVLLLQELAPADPHAVLAAARHAERQRTGDVLPVEVPRAGAEGGQPADVPRGGVSGRFDCDGFRVGR